jgi:biopolymer transport protein ExbB/TolQ
MTDELNSLRNRMECQEQWRAAHDAKIDVYWRNQFSLNEKNEKTIVRLENAVNTLVAEAVASARNAQNALKVVGALGPTLGAATAYVLGLLL